MRQGFAAWHVCTDLQHVISAHVTTPDHGTLMVFAWGCLHHVFSGTLSWLCRFTKGTSYCSWIGVVSLFLCNKAAMVYAKCSEFSRRPDIVCPSADVLFDSWLQLYRPLLIGTISGRALLPCCQPQRDVASVSARLLLPRCSSSVLAFIAGCASRLPCDSKASLEMCCRGLFYGLPDLQVSQHCWALQPRCAAFLLLPSRCSLLS